MKGKYGIMKELKLILLKEQYHIYLNANPDVHWQVESFTEIILNIMLNFIPNEIKRINPRDPPWLTKPLRNMLKKQKRLYRNFKRHGYKVEDQIRVNTFSGEC